MLSAFPCGRTQHVRRMRCSIASMLHATHACDTTLSSYRAIAVIFQVISVLPFSAKNTFETAYLF